MYHRIQDNTQFRLLELLPGSRDGPISTVLHHQTGQLPDFEAVSYTWGDPSVTKTVYCNDLSFEATLNLYNLLADFRLEDKSRLLWVDAMCINQSDLDEKSDQVMMMHLIYGMARRCLVWLGRPDEHSEIAIHLIHDIAARFAGERGVDVGNLDVDLEESGRDLEIGTKIRFNGLANFNSPEWASLLHFFSRSWFTRVWIIQEVHFAKSVVFCLGEERMPFSFLYHTSDWLMSNLPSFGPRPIAEAGSTLNTWSNSVTMMRGENIAGLTRQSSDNLLSHGKMFQATDPRDKIYALMNFAAFRRDAPGMRPDYTKSTQQVCTDVTAEIIKNTKNLRILACVVKSEGWDENFPSWVPQWHLPGSLRTAANIWYNHFSAAGAAPEKRQTDATISSETLTVSGTELDVIADVCEIDVLEKLPILFTPSAPWAPYELRSDATYPTKEAVITAYAMALTGGCGEFREVMGIKCPPNMVADHRVKFVALLDLLRAADSSRGGGASASDGRGTAARCYPPGMYSESSPCLPGDLPEAQREALLVSFYNMVKTYVAGPRALFRTKQGYLGLGINAPRAGDRVCILSGGAVPFVLRERRDKSGYALVGDAYVHGVMEGEAAATKQTATTSAFCIH